MRLVLGLRSLRNMWLSILWVAEKESLVGCVHVLVEG